MLLRSLLRSDLPSLRPLRTAIGLALLCTTLSAGTGHAQTGPGSTAQGSATLNPAPTWPTGFTIGGGVAANDNMNTTSGFKPSATDPTYTSGASSIQPALHILAEVPLTDALFFAPRIAYNNYSLKWNAPSGATTSSLSVSEPALSVDLLAKYAINQLHFMGGFDLSFPLGTPSYTTVATSGGTSASTNVPNSAGFLPALKVGAGYDIPVNASNTTWITPELFATYGFSKSGNSPDQYSPMTISLGASIKFALASPPPPPPPPVPTTIKISARGVLPDGTPTTEPVSPQQALHTRQSIPLLPYVFFDDHSAAISSRYSRSGATGFNEQTSLTGKDALAANHNVLDVIGERLKTHPTANVRLVGTNMNTGDEKNDITLSKARAQAVADYLISTWGVAPSRITIDQRNLPELPTNPLTEAGRQENRRVEISSPNWPDLTAPVKIESRKGQTVGSTVVKYDIAVSPEPTARTYKGWSLMLDKDGQTIGTPMSGVGAPPSSTTLEIPDATNLLNQPLHYSISVTDDKGETTKADGYTRIVAKTVDRDNLEKYAMLSFDFDSHEINKRARQMLELISESINRDATGVKIDGYCDKTGSEQYNQALSESRANSVVNTLRSMTTLPANVTVHGHGFKELKFDNALPEGRQLNRRVEFEIEKGNQ